MVIWMLRVLCPGNKHDSCGEVKQSDASCIGHTMLTPESQRVREGQEGEQQPTLSLHVSRK